MSKPPKSTPPKSLLKQRLEMMLRQLRELGLLRERATRNIKINRVLKIKDIEGLATDDVTSSQYILKPPRGKEGLATDDVTPRQDIPKPPPKPKR